MMAKLTGRPESRIRERHRHLFEANLLNRVKSAEDTSVPFLDPQHWVYFLDEKGGDYAYNLGYLPEPRGTEQKSRMLMGHDLEITRFHMALSSVLPKETLLEWKQWRGELKDTVLCNGESHALIPDAYFSFQHQSYFLEVVKSQESEYVNGESNIVRKCKLYLDYREGFTNKYGAEDFRVIFILPTRERVLRLLMKLEDIAPNRKLWFTDEDSYKENIKGKIFWTPKDYRDTTYGLFA